MPITAAVGAAIATGAATLGAGALSYAGSKNAANTQKQSSDAAIAFAKEQEAERRREWDIQTAAAKQQWDTQQANLAPYRAARLEILRKHGLNVPDMVPPKPPDFSAGPPPNWKPGDPIPGGAAATPKNTGSSAGSWLAAAGGLGLQGLGAGLAAAKQSPYTTTGGPYTTTTAGVPGGPAGPPSSLMNPAGTGIISPANLSNWSDWSNYYGAPGQTYQGE